MKSDSTFAIFPLACTPGPRIAAAALAAALILPMQPVSAATIADTPTVLQYNAAVNESNDVNIRPRALASGENRGQRPISVMVFVYEVVR